ncbi:hypothetical protein A9Q91_04775 [Candidatus Gracilibacteria bacterium 28_42_T64]|nr:hypothetical protein A9Q91_04775 [Candidatus Gracilibacteria bacterium 28_42_T64]
MIFSPGNISHEQFKKYIGIQNTPGKWDTFYSEKTHKHINYIKWIPGLKMIGIGNSISMNCATKDSDIDLFIVTSPNRLWLVRILITLIFQILGVRKTAKKHAGRFCLSFFATTDGLNFSSFALKDDIYLYFRILYFKPILDFDNTYQSFLDKNSSWSDFSEYKNIINNHKPGIKFIKNTGIQESRFLTIVNNLLKRMLITKTQKTFKKIGKPYGVIINDNMLKFHNNDIREKIRDEL